MNKNFAYFFVALLTNVTFMMAQNDRIVPPMESSYEIVIPLVFDSLESFSEGLASFRDANGLWGVIDKTGKDVIPSRWKGVQSFSEGLAVVENESNKWGVIDKSGKVIIICKWDSICSFHEGLAAVENETNRWGFIDKNGNEVIPCVWKRVGDFSDGLAMVENNNGKKGYIDKTGNVVIPCRWDGAFNFSEGFASVRRNQKWFLIDRNGKEVKMQGRDIILPFRDGLALAVDLNLRQGICSGFIDKNGIAVISMKNGWSNVTSFNEGLVALGKKDALGKDRMGYIDKSGHEAIPFVWSEARDFSENLAAVKENEHDGWGYINKAGEKVISFIWKVANNFSDSLAVVQDYNGKWGAIRYIPSNKDLIDKQAETQKQLAQYGGKDETQAIKKNVLEEKQAPPTNEPKIVGKHQTQSAEQKNGQSVVQEKPRTIEQRKKERRIALIIGNANYGPKSHLEQLKSPKKDAKDVFSKLKELGFEMMSDGPIINAEKNNMELVIGDFARKSKDYDVALLYYSGHGIQGDSGYDATNYLIPTNAELDYRENMSGQCIDLNKIINILNERGKDKATIVLIDACRTVLHLPSRYDSYRTKGSGDELRGLNIPRYKIKDSSLTQQPRGVCIVYATGAGDIAIDGQENENSCFTQGLLECLDEDKNEALPNFIQLLQEKVEHISDSRQSPALYNGMKGRFYFNPNK